MRILITGAAGFLGSHLADRFLREGHDVIGMDNLITGARENFAHQQGNRRFQFVLHDVSRFIQVDGPLDGVLHFASPASPIDYLELPIQTLKVGSLGTHNALGLAKAKGARFFLASTSEVYGDPQVHPGQAGQKGQRERGKVGVDGAQALSEPRLRESGDAKCSRADHRWAEPCRQSG